MADSLDSKLGTWRIDAELVDKLASHARLGQRRRFARHEVLYEQGEISSKFYFVQSGLVQVSIIRLDGAEVILELMGPQTICGEGSAFDLLPRFSRAVAIENTEAVEFDTSRMDEVFAQHPQFASTLLRVTSLKQRVLAIRIEHLTSREPEERILDLLSRLREMFSIPHAEGHLIVTYLTHEQIAAMTGTSRVTVTRALARLREQRMIDVVDRHILIRKLSH